MRSPSSFSIDDVVLGRSARMRAIFEFIRVIAPADGTVLICGESGTGKEVVANVIHYLSPRRHRPFVPVSCALFSETLIESELFGHERGAFTGAIKDRPGRFELAQGGTLFLDDVDDVPLGMQIKLLRVLQTREIERLGGTRPISVDVRILAGTKRDLKQLVAEGRFREDLYYRLNVIPIVLPALRERREDIPLLAEHFIARFSRRLGREPVSVAPAVMEAFLRYPWPGNVRELENACERLVQTCTCGTARLGCVPASILFHPDQQHRAAGEPVVRTPAPVSLDDRLREVESSLIRWALQVTAGNKSRAAELLRIKRSTLGDRIARCGLEKADGAGVKSPVA
ncbi:MAG TPA: sigma-54 dependent transcriptional regulator [Vicinamibacterales bacterium]|nr:sigma-54 dependent transcriptional regulator [Vicinamibacterales bacterium]